MNQDPSRPELPGPEEVVMAQVVELDYASPKQGIGRAGRHVVCRLTATLPARCWKTGITPDEAGQQGVRLVEVKRTITWVPSWLTGLAAVGLLLFGPLLIAVLVIYFVTRRKARVTFMLRRDIWWRRIFLGKCMALLSLGTVVLCVVVAIQTEQWWLLAVGFLGGILLAVGAAILGRVIGVRKVVNEWAYLSGAGREFLERETFDFAVT